MNYGPRNPRPQRIIGQFFSMIGGLYNKLGTPQERLTFPHVPTAQLTSLCQRGESAAEKLWNYQDHLIRSRGLSLLVLLRKLFHARGT